MNKAFTKESDYDPTLDVVARPRDVLPPGVRNYITAAGAARLRAELSELTDVVRPAITERLSELAAAGRRDDPDHADAKRRLLETNRQIAWLDERIQSLEVVVPGEGDPDRVRFGAHVTALDDQDQERTWQIVGIDEADPAEGSISWISPIAKALLGREVGDEVAIALPRGRRRLEILEIAYD